MDQRAGPELRAASRLRSTRRAWLPVAFCLLLGAACGSSGGQGPAGDAPNVVLITADDLGWRDLGSYGNDQLATPHLDRLAAEGLRFTRAFVTTPSCSSSRATLATGQYPHTNGVTGLVHRFPERSLPAGTPTLASLLRDAG